MKKRLKAIKSLDYTQDFINKQQNQFDNNYYETLHKKIVNYLTSGEIHSTLVGIIICLDGNSGNKDVIEAANFADYIINFLKKVN